MLVRKAISEKDGIYFITFTSNKWLQLFKNIYRRLHSNETSRGNETPKNFYAISPSAERIANTVIIKMSIPKTTKATTYVFINGGIFHSIPFSSNKGLRA